MSEISSNFGMESLNVAMLKRSSDNQGQMALALLEGALEERCLRRISAVAVVDASAEAHHAVVEAEHRLACNKVWGKVLELALHKLHGKHTILSLQRA